MSSSLSLSHNELIVLVILGVVEVTLLYYHVQVPLQPCDMRRISYLVHCPGLRVI